MLFMNEIRFGAIHSIMQSTELCPAEICTFRITEAFNAISPRRFSSESPTLNG